MDRRQLLTSLASVCALPVIAKGAQQTVPPLAKREETYHTAPEVTIHLLGEDDSVLGEAESMEFRIGLWTNPPYAVCHVGILRLKSLVEGTRSTDVHCVKLGHPSLTGPLSCGMLTDPYFLATDPYHDSQLPLRLGQRYVFVMKEVLFIDEHFHTLFQIA